MPEVIFNFGVDRVCNSDEGVGDSLNIVALFVWNTKKKLKFDRKCLHDIYNGMKLFGLFICH